MPGSARLGTAHEGVPQCRGESASKCLRAWSASPGQTTPPANVQSKYIFLLHDEDDVVRRRVLEIMQVDITVFELVIGWQFGIFVVMSSRN